MIRKRFSGLLKTRCNVPANSTSSQIAGIWRNTNFLSATRFSYFHEGDQSEVGCKRDALGWVSQIGTRRPATQNFRSPQTIEVQLFGHK